jgi:hypothetical protein
VAAEQSFEQIVDAESRVAEATVEAAAWCRIASRSPRYTTHSRLRSPAKVSR